MPPSSEESKKKPGFNKYASYKIESEIEKFEFDLRTKSANVRDIENPGVEINIDHVQKALQSINKEHLLEALNESKSKSQIKYLQLQLIIIIILLVTDIVLKFYTKIPIVLTLAVQFLKEYGGLLAFITVLPLAITLWMMLKNKKKDDPK